jgi:hypothetical protein
MPERSSRLALSPGELTERRRLRAYQMHCARAILRSVRRREGKTFSVMFARQMGKNELSAAIEAHLLWQYREAGGSMIKAAPTFRPQILNSVLRLGQTLERSERTRGQWQAQFGHIVRCGQASIAFYSAERHANVVGATASLLLEIDEAQDVDPDKYDREFRPMASSTNATTVLYGTAWTEDTVLERQRRVNLAAQTPGNRLHFEFDYTVLAATNPYYRAFVEAEIRRLGRDHPSIRTQYLLQTLADAGRLFSADQLEALGGTHLRERDPLPNATYIAGIDLAGVAETPSENSQLASGTGGAGRPHDSLDSTVVTIARLEWDALGRPAARVVEHLRWTGRDHVWQYQRLAELCERWAVSRVCVDASGIGAGIAAFLAERLGPRVERFVFTAASKSALAYGMLTMINTGRLSLYKEDTSEEWRECRAQLRAVRANPRAGEILAWSVPESEGHDDFVVSLALCARAAESGPPPAHGGLIRARPDGEGGW